MEYYPSNYEIQMYKFFSERKRALNKIEKLGIEMPYISGTLLYEQLLANYIMLDISNSETDYLKQGVESLFKCLKAVQNSPVLSKQDVETEVYNKRGGNLDKKIAEQGQDGLVAKWANKEIERLIDSDISLKKTTEEVLLKEISEFKIRLGRVNITVIIDKDVLNFKKSDKMTALYILEKEIIDNPYPHIFNNVEAYILFNDLYSIYKGTDNPLADFSFIYRQMAEKDKLIKESFKPEKFRDWINSEPYNADVNTKFKTYDKCFTKEKYSFYNYVKSKQ